MVAGWVSDYIGIPYVERGRSVAGCDCWGLVRLVLFERFGKVLPSLAEDYAKVDPALTARMVDQTAALVRAQKVDAPEPGDVAVLRSLSAPSAHVGIVVPGGYLLHVDRGVNTCVVPLDSPRIAHRLEGFYRV
jgi:cell wall-associated NlpC family hydrolase